MGNNQLKVSLVKRLLNCHDPEILEAIDQLLKLEAPKLPSVGSPPPALKTELKDKDLQDIQQSIDQLFGQDPEH